MIARVIPLRLNVDGLLCLSVRDASVREEGLCPTLTLCRARGSHKGVLPLVNSMNVSELARRVNLPPQDLYEILPRFGFDIGRRAIKIDDRLAQQFLKQWPRIRREWQRQREKEHDEEERKRRRDAVRGGTAKEVAIPSVVTVRAFADLLQLPVSEVLQELLRNGILANLNEQIDYATAAIIAEDLGCKPVPTVTDDDTIAAAVRSDLTEAADMSGATQRPPVVVVMGHVDHGKTTILDAIRETNVAAGEVGGITQHIGAYQAIVNDRLVTFIDTPGHEAFTTMRSRGARVADIAILVVAADDGVQPQTKEALKIIQAAKLPFLVAVNKMDKPEADLERVRSDLGALGVTAEDWGGKIPFAPLSARTKEGIPQLLEIVLLIADIEADRLRANADGVARTVTIESHVDKQAGPVATLLVQSGTLRVGDTLAVGDRFLGKVRAMEDHRGDELASASPSTPVRILGFKDLPEVGDEVVIADPATLTKKKRKTARRTTTQSVVVTTPKSEEEQTEEAALVLPVILRADVLGSLEAAANEIERIGDASARVKIIGRGLGYVTENDVQQAQAAGGIIFGFNALIPDAIGEHAREANVQIVTEKIIYDLLKRVRSALEDRLPEETTREELGVVSVLALFKKGQQWQIVGGKVTSGRVVMGRGVEVVRDRDGVTGKLLALQAGKEEVREVVEGQECGLKIGGELRDIAMGDVLTFARVETKKKWLATT